ncbi:MAG TPA: (4Fe-4S)-binding protein [Bellilinea sp.]
MENPAEKKPEERKRPDVERVYQNDQIAVYWEPKLCIHVGNCYHGLPQVFNPTARPWVDVNAQTADRIARVVMTCPTGALHFERLDGAEQESGPSETIIDARPNGPLFIRGQLKIVEVGGHVLREDTRVALCRCGHSENKPFCDGTHRKIGFKTTKS